LRLGGGIDPAGMDAAVKRFSDLGVDGSAESHHAAERALDVTAGAAEPFVEVEVAERRVEIVAPHQPDHPPAEPDAFRVSGGAVDRLRRFHELVGLALAILGGVCRGLLGGGVLSTEVTALRDSSPDAHEKGQGRNGDALKNCNSKPGTNPTHEIPD